MGKRTRQGRDGWLAVGGHIKVWSMPPCPLFGPRRSSAHREVLALTYPDLRPREGALLHSANSGCATAAIRAKAGPTHTFWCLHSMSVHPSRTQCMQRCARRSLICHSSYHEHMPHVGAVRDDGKH